MSRKRCDEASRRNDGLSPLFSVLMTGGDGGQVEDRKLIIRGEQAWYCTSVVI